VSFWSVPPPADTRATEQQLPGERHGKLSGPTRENSPRPLASSVHCVEKVDVLLPADKGTFEVLGAFVDGIDDPVRRQRGIAGPTAGALADG
jgi:hypothetical protein